MASRSRSDARAPQTSRAKPAPSAAEGFQPPLRQFLHAEQPVWNRSARQWQVVAAGELYFFDEAAADRAVEFIARFCTLPEGGPFQLEPEQRAFVRCLFGWRSVRTGLRRFREALLFVASGYGKSMLFSAILLYILYAVAPPGAELYNIAADIEQARPIFQSSVGMVRRNPALERRVEIFGENPNALRRAIVHRNGSFYQVLSSTVHAKHGKRIFCVAIDEEHVLPGDGREIVGTLSTMAKKHRDSLVLKATTAGFEQDHVCYEDFGRACLVRDGLKEVPHLLPALYFAAPDDDWTQPATWRKANPNLGVTIAEADVASECEEAKQIPSRQNQFKRLRCNLWTEQETIWLPIDKWDACSGIGLQEGTASAVPKNGGAAASSLPQALFSIERLRAFEASLAGRDCFGGLDLSSNTDLAALARVFTSSADSDSGAPQAGVAASPAAPATDSMPGGHAVSESTNPESRILNPVSYPVLFRFWLPFDQVRTLVHRFNVTKDLLEWTAPCHCHSGGDPLACPALVHCTPGDVVDYDFIRRDINALNEVTPFRELAVDKFGATQIITQLTGDLGEDRVLAVPQTTAFFTPPMRDLERLVLVRGLAHAGHPVARWNALCLAAKQDAHGGIRPVKIQRQTSPKRIDGIVAALNAFSRAIVHRDVHNVVRGAVLI